MTTENKVSFGLSTWDEKTSTGRPQNDLPRLDFLRLKEGNNVLRIVTPPYKYHMIRYKSPGNEKDFGKRVNCAYPKYDNCPTIEAGYKSKIRYLVGVIERNGQDGPALKVLDMSILVYEQLQNFKDDPEVGSPDSYDINIRFNPKASSPQGFYSVIPRPKAPLSAADVELIEAFGTDKLEEVMTRYSTPPAPDAVRKRLESLGWTGKKEAETKSNGQGDLETVNDDDYKFPQPTAAN